MKTAKQVGMIDGWTGDARIFELSEPVPYCGGETKFVIVYATVAPYSGPETYIFPALGPDADTVIDFGELDGSYRGGLSHSKALEGAGFEVVK